MPITKNNQAIGEITKNSLAINEIYYGSTLVFSSTPEIPQIVFRNIDANGRVSLATGTLDGLFDNIVEIQEEALKGVFQNCKELTGTVSFPSLVTVKRSGLKGTFNSCQKISSALFPKLTTVEDDGLSWTFASCDGLTSIRFPSLTSVSDYGLLRAFQYCDNLRAIHFRRDARSVIESLSGYAYKFGATNATIYFDL